MFIERVVVKNFRLLRDFSIDLQKDLSLVVGKNNCGKTSLLKVMDKFLNGGESKFSFEDFSLQYHTELEGLFADDIILDDDYKVPGIYLQLYIKYDNTDDLEYISPLVSLDPDNYYVVIQFSFSLSKTQYGFMRVAYEEFMRKENAKKTENKAYVKKTWKDFLSDNLLRFFRITRESLPVNKDGNVIKGKTVDLQSIRDVFKLEDVISFRYIDARRTVDNKEADRTLSGQTSKLYQQLESSEGDVDKMEALRDKLREMDVDLTGNYGDVFDDLINKVKKFGGMQQNDTIIKIVSNLREDILLKDHTIVVYDDDGKQLPETHNGLGYMNLISMIFEIESIRRHFARRKERKPADINILFIEEPEAHTHPQMQYVFIKNIKQLLKQYVIGNGDVKREIQTIVSTHSAHIVAESDFEDLKYLKRDNKNGVIAKNLTDLEKEYEGHSEWFRFLKQYLTLDRSELFFADKAIFIEGDTERILMPTFMRMVDEVYAPGEGEYKLTSQNISIVTVGNYTHIFTKFFNFIGFKKICVITDLDICDKEAREGKDGAARLEYIAARFDAGKEQYTTNSSLKAYFGKNLISDYCGISTDGRKVIWNCGENKWKQNINGNVMVCFQSRINDYQPRSFEDAFFETNKKYMAEGGKMFNGLCDSSLTRFRENKDSYELAKEGIKSKATFAVDLLIDKAHEKEGGYIGWDVPQYIVDGLLWLRKD